MSQKAERQAWTEFFEKQQACSNSASSSGTEEPDWSTPETIDGGITWRNLSKPSASSTPHGVKSIDFMVPTEAIPQGSMRGICTTKADGSPVTVLKSDNPRLHAFRDLVGTFARNARSMAGVYELFAGPEIPVRVSITFVFEKPKSAPKGRIRPTVKPDMDKLTRACMDALTGILYHDDAQVVDDEHHKFYGTPEGVYISVQIVEE
jgi:Holliday junction resolvase RusA-like endonuclease